MGTKLHFRLSSLLLSVFAFVPIASHAQNNAQFDPFVEVGSEKIRARWCLQGQFPIIQTYGHESWRNAGVVRLSPINHTPDCTSNQVVFAEKDKLFVQEEDGELLLSSSDDKQWKLKELVLSPSPSVHPKFWKGRDAKRKLDIYVFLASAENSNGKPVKYYLLEAFNDACTVNRPEKSGVIEPYQGAGTCGNLSLPTIGTKTSGVTFFQTDVGGGGEKK